VPAVPNLEEAELYIQRLLESFGLPFSAAVVYAKLVLSGRAMTINELAEATGLGRSTVSTALRILEQNNLVYYRKRGKTKLYIAQRGLHQLLLFPTRVLHEYLLPLHATLEEAAREEPRLRGLIDDLVFFENLAREVEELITRRTRELRGTARE